jgi:hypothetical protein
MSLPGSTHRRIAEVPKDGIPPHFAGLNNSGTLDYALRTVMQSQNQLSAMADTKASILITVCSIVLTVGITRFEAPILRWPLVLLTTCTLFALLFAILTVLPSQASPRTPDGGLDVNSSWFNLFYFGHFAELPRERFEAMLDEVARDDAKIYGMLARDIYGQGIVLARKKYRMLRWSYLTFLLGLVTTALGAGWTVLFRLN